MTNYLRILSVMAVLFALKACHQTNYDYPFQNPTLSVEERVDNLVSLLTLEEKVGQMTDYAEAIPHLDIPEYNWWNEVLHGVGRAGYATIFPQAIGMSASFNDGLMLQVADIISDELRAKYHHYSKLNDRQRYRGLTVWTPNINIFRDPRWGRGQETYGEDPWLTSRMSVAMIKGLQGDDPNYLKLVATPKHFAVHSGPEPLRHVFNASISARDFMDTYSPAFEASIKEANAYSVMSAYNRLWGESCTASDTLLNKILRDKWGFKGYVVSDCGAVENIFQSHKLVETPAEAAALAVKSGCDLNCGEVYPALIEAVEKGLITEQDIDVAVKRLFTARMKLGMFDPDEMVPYSKIPISVIDSEEHRKTALKMAEESMVLLKNESNLLPINTQLKNILVTGPNANDEDILLGNYHGQSEKIVTPLAGIKNKLPGAVVNYAIGCPRIGDDMFEFVPVDYLSFEGKKGWKAEYFNNESFIDDPVLVRQEDRVDILTEGVGIIPNVNSYHYTARWTADLTVPSAGTYTFAINADDGFRLYIDGERVMDLWKWNNRRITQKYTLELEKDKPYRVKIEYYQSSGAAEIQLKWSEHAVDQTKKALKMAEEAEVIIMCGGISAYLEAEEAEIPYEGFEGGDRTSMDLPGPQKEYLKKLVETGKPVVLVLFNGSAMSINWESENIPAILEAWYPGEEGGHALANILFGDCNPAGRLPVTFYKSVDQLPPFEDYTMKGRTYRYFEGEALYPFGYGLSYTSFSYSNLEVPETASAGEDVTLTVEVQNTGQVDGDEVVQLYVSNTTTQFPTPIMSLQGFRRIHLKANEKQEVTFVMHPRQLSIINDRAERVAEPGTFELTIGGGQPGEQGREGTNYIQRKIEIAGTSVVLD